MSIQHPVNMPSAVFVVSCFFWAYNHKIPSDDALKQPLLCTNVPIISSSTLTCCHDDACQHFSPCVRGRKVVCQLTELIHNQARDRISQNLELHTRTHTHTKADRTTGSHAHMQTHKHELVSDMSAYKACLMLSSPRALCTCHSVSFGFKQHSER